MAMFRCEEIMESAYAAFATKFTPIRTKVRDEQKRSTIRREEKRSEAKEKKQEKT